MAKKRVGLVLLVSLVMAIVRTALVNFNIEKNEYGTDTYYLLDNFKTVSFAVVTAALLTSFLIPAFISGKGKTVVHDTKSSTVSVVSCTVGFVILGTVIIYAASYLWGSEPMGSKLDTVIFVVSVLSAAVFLAGGLRQQKESVLAIFVLFPLFLTVFRMLNDFIKSESAPLANSGGYHILGLVAMMMYFLCEGKAFLSKGSAFFYYYFGYAAILLLSVYAIPNLFLHCMGLMKFDYSASLSVVDLITVVYIYVRITASGTVPKEKPKKTAKVPAA